MNYVVIGASAAGISAIKKLRELEPDAGITLISKDTEIYSRCVLYHYLDDSRTLEEMNFAGLDFAERLGIQWRKGIAAQSVDVAQQLVSLDDGTTVSYDKLLIATGSHTNCPPIPGLREGKNIYGFRNLEDARSIRNQIEQWERIFVMGAGLVGIDVIAGLLAYKKEITLADMGPYMLPIQLDEVSASNYASLFANHGVRQYYQTGAKEFVLNESGNCEQVILQYGTCIPVDAVINCAGVRSNVEFLAGTPLETDRFGLIVDSFGRTNIEHVYGAGDVTGRTPIWPTAVREGITAAYSMCGCEVGFQEYFAIKSSMYFLELPTVSIGKVNRLDETCCEHILVNKKNEYLKVVEQDGVVVGAILQGNLEYSGYLTDSIREQRKISEVLECVRV